MTCLFTLYAAGPCSTCRNPQHAGVHLVEDGPRLALHCENHCPVHGPRDVEWSVASVTIAGEQKGLF